jgi:hypothetical protein
MKITSLLASALIRAVAARDTIYLVNSYKGNGISSGMAYYADGHEQNGVSRPDDYVDVAHGSNVHWEGQNVKGKLALQSWVELHTDRTKVLSVVVYLSRLASLQMLVASKGILGLARVQMGFIRTIATRVLVRLASRGCYILWMAGLSMLSTGVGLLIKIPILGVIGETH